MSFKLVANSVIVQYLGKIIGLAVSLVSVGLLTRYLGVAGYGEYTAALAIAGLVVTVSDFGFFWSTIHNTLTQTNRLIAAREISGIKLLLIVFLALLSMIVVWLGNFPLVVKQSYTVLLIFVYFSSLNNILVALYQMEYRMIRPTLADVASRLLNLAFISLGVMLKMNLMWFIVAVSITGATNYLVNWFGLKKSIGLVWPKIKGINWKFYYQAVFLIGFMYLFSVIYTKFDVIFLSWIKESKDVGIYGLSIKIIEVILIISSLFIASVFPLLVKYYHEDRQQFIKLVSQSFLILSAIGLPILFFGPFFAKDIVKLVGGNDYTYASTITYAGRQITAVSTLSLLLIFAALSYCGVIFNIALLAAQRVKKLLIVNSLAVAVNIMLNLLLIPKYSYLAAALVTVFTEIFVTVTNGLIFIFIFKYRLPNRQFFLVLLSCLLTFGVLWFAKDHHLIIRLSLIIIFYPLLLLIVFPEAKKSVVSIRRLFRKKGILVG